MVDKVWMRESVPGQKSATVMLNLSVTKAGRLLSVSSPVAASGEIQGVVMHHGKPQTGTVDSLKLAAHSTTLFGTRGVYLTLVGLKQPLNVGRSGADHAGGGNRPGMRTPSMSRPRCVRWN